MIKFRIVTLLLALVLVGPMSSSAALALLVASSTASSSCRCECVEGLPQTLCGSVDAAQQQTWVCPPSYTCPVPRPAESVAESLVAPHPQAENCRAVRVWHRQRQAYTGVNICDVHEPIP
jgi:hypothetical protein